MYSALWVMQSTTGLRPMDCINKSGLIKGSEVFWLILPSQIVIRLIWSYETLITLVLIQQCFATWFKPNNALLHSMVWIPQCLFDLDVHVLDQSGSRQYVDSQTMLFIAKWQPLMLAKLANQRIKRSRFHLVGYAGKLYPWSQKFDSSIVSQLSSFVYCSDSLHRD